MPWAVGAALLAPASVSAQAAPLPVPIAETHRCTASRDYCIVIEYTGASPERVPLPGDRAWASEWKEATWTGENGRAPGVTVETLWG